MAIDINIPSQVKNYANLAAFPATGTLKTIFIAEDTNKTYRWTGSAYVEISPAGASGVTIGTTAITSGTVGRVLFEGTGNVVQQSSSLSYNDTTKVFTLTGPIGSAIQHTALTNYNDFGGFQLNVSGGTERAFMKLQPNTGEFKIGTTANGGYFTTIHSGGVERIRVFSATGNIGINTTTDAGFKLDVNGTARVQSSLSWGNARGTLTFTSTDAYMDASQSGGSLIFRTNGNTEVTRFTSTQNILIGTTTDAGYKLDVNGTARMSGNAHFGTGVAVTVGTDQVISMRSSTTTARFYLQNSGTGTNSLSGVSFDLSNSIFEITNRQASGTTAFVTNGAERMRVASTGNVLINTTTDAGYKLDVNGTARVSGAITGTSFTATSNGSSYSVGAFNVLDYGNGCRINYASGAQKVNIYSNTSGGGLTLHNSGNASIGSEATEVTSAILNVPSTTKGFLPPRMTTTQKNAIATPTAGLQIYDSTLNRPCFYDGTSWITL